MVQRRNIDFYLKCKQIIEKPYAVISKENKTKPTVNFNSRLNGEQINHTPDLGSCENQENKTCCIDPVPDSDR
jgi:hypothetical protein